MSITPFHDLADQLEVIASEVRTLGDSVHTGTYTVPVPPAEDIDEEEETDGEDGEDGDGDDDDVMPLSTELPAE